MPWGDDGFLLRDEVFLLRVDAEVCDVGKAVSGRGTTPLTTSYTPSVFCAPTMRGEKARQTAISNEQQMAR